MGRDERSRRRVIASVAGYYDKAWRRHGVTRYVAILVVCGAVYFTVPDWRWSAWVAVLMLLAMAIDMAGDMWVQRVMAEPARMETLEGALRTRQRVLAVVTVIILFYALPNIALAFAPGAGPKIGLMFCLTGLILMASQHVMTTNMFPVTCGSMALATMLNALMMGEGQSRFVFALLGCAAIANALKTARAGAESFEALIDARIDAEEDADTLDRRVAEQTAALREAKILADAASEAKSRFIANMSHELRTPLNAVIGYSEIILEDLASGDVKECNTHVARIQAAATHLLGLISDVLDLAKVEANAFHIAVEPIDVRQLVGGVIDAVTPLARQKGIALKFDVDAQVARIEADPLRLRQCLMNLVSNATKFTDAGDVCVTVQPALYNGAPALSFAVRDSGIGIDAETLSRLFTPFVQADDSMTRKAGGAGLGLSITRRLARLMGGDVTVVSEPGEGSTFTLVIPRAREPAALEAA